MPSASALLGALPVLPRCQLSPGGCWRRTRGVPWPSSSALGAFQSADMLGFTPKVPGLAAAPGKRIWHLVVYIFGFTLLVAEGGGFLPGSKLFDLREVFKSLPVLGGRRCPCFCGGGWTR